MQRADTQGMQHHLNEISANIAPGAHAVLVLDQAGWHTTAKLDKPDNITLLSLPSRSPELNPAENVWEYLRGRWLSNHIFEDYDAILDALCDAWNRLIDEPALIQSIGSRQWAISGET
jgi:transposase